MFSLFSREVHHYEQHLPTEDEIIEWLALMQHHGAPTRLLDCTHSFYVATFFALDSANQDAAVWAFNADKMQMAFAELLMNYNTISADEAKALKRMVPLKFNDQLLGLKGTLLNMRTPGAVLVEPFRRNERLRIQQGLFLCPLDLTVSIDQNLRSLWTIDAKAADMEVDFKKGDWSLLFGLAKVIKIVFPKDIHGVAINDLAHMNITSATLFPGLDGFARSLAHRFWVNDKSSGIPRLANIKD
jgi:hypothetical protein